MMKKYFSFMSFLFVAAIILFATNSGFSQGVSLNPNSLPVITNNDFGVACSGGQIHDDGVAENGYGWNASAGDPSGFCAKFIPTVYPYKFTKFCIALTRLAAGPANFTFTITMWKSTNGMPGVMMDTTTVTAVGVPVWTTVTIFDFNLPSTWAQVTTPGDSVFIGIKYTVTTQLNVFIGGDESTTTPIWPNWATTAAGPWTNPISYWSTARSFIFRAEGQQATTYAHDFGPTNFLSIPSEIVINTSTPIKAKIMNFGTSAETNVPIKFYVNNVQVGSAINLSLAAGASDSVSFPWTPTVAGSTNLMVTSNLAGDLYRGNDTLRTTVTVVASALQTIFCDPLTTLSNWTLSTAGGTVPWASISAYTRYTMPGTATPPGMGCDVDLAGSGNSSNSTATLTTALNCTGKTGLYLEFDDDWYVLGSDQALVDLSTDGGSTWSNLVTWTTSHRSSHEIIQLPTAANKAAVKIRFTAIQPSWDWWWVIDNICIKGYLLVGVGNSNSNVPKTYSLSQNYPNPFNPVTRISFELPKQGFVNLKVYDILGKEVKTLVNEVRGAGSYSVDFNASEFSTGVYFYRLESNGFTDTKKMMLIK